MRLCAILLTGTLVTAAVAQAPRFTSIADALNGLASPNFAVRERASAYLFAAGRAAEPALEKAQRSKDQEVVRRTRAILDKFRWGIYPDTPKAILDELAKFQTAENPASKLSAWQSLLKQSPHGTLAAARALQRIKDTVDPEWLRSTSSALYAEIPEFLLRKEVL